MFYSNLDQIWSTQYTKVLEYILRAISSGSNYVPLCFDFLLLNSTWDALLPTYTRRTFRAGCFLDITFHRSSISEWVKSITLKSYYILNDIRSVTPRRDNLFNLIFWLFIFMINFYEKKIISKFFFFFVKKPVFATWLVEKHLVIARSSTSVKRNKMPRVRRRQNYHSVNNFNKGRIVACRNVVSRFLVNSGIYSSINYFAYLCPDSDFCYHSFDFLWIDSLMNFVICGLVKPKDGSAPTNYCARVWTTHLLLHFLSSPSSWESRIKLNSFGYPPQRLPSPKSPLSQHLQN